MPTEPQQLVYMDNHATTRVDPRVVEAMLPYFTQKYGNPAACHPFGDEAREAVEASRESIAAAIGADAKEIVFTSGATESNNLAIRGVAERDRRRGNHLVSVDHRTQSRPRSARPTCNAAATKSRCSTSNQHGSPRAGWLDPQKVADALRDDTCLVSVMLANNEIGVIQPLAEIAAICKSRGVLAALRCHASRRQDAQSTSRQLDVDLMSFTAHKIYGPKGIGALYVRSRNPIVRLDPQISGGGQQEGRRSGTLNVPGIVGFATALEALPRRAAARNARLAALRDQLAAGILAQLDEVQVCGPALDESYKDGTPLRLPGNLELSFGNVDGEALLMAMGNLAVSSGAACSSTDPDPSHVLLALGLSEDAARSSLRFGLGRFNTAAEVDLAIERVATAVRAAATAGSWRFGEPEST